MPLFYTFSPVRCSDGDYVRWERQKGNWRGTKLIEAFYKRI
jgi:hypothetical protein